MGKTKMVDIKELLEKLELDIKQKNHQSVLDAVGNAVRNGLSQNNLLALLVHRICQYSDGPFLREFFSYYPNLFLVQNEYGWTAAHVLAYLGKTEGIDILGECYLTTGNEVGFNSETGIVMTGLLPHVTHDDQYPRQAPLQFARMMGHNDCAKKIEEYLTIFRQRAQAQQNVVQQPVTALNVADPTVLANVASNPVQATNTTIPTVSIGTSAAYSATTESLARELAKTVNEAERLKNMEMHDACQSFAIEKFKALLLEGRNPRYENGNGWMPIHLAAFTNNLEAIDALGQFAIQTSQDLGFMAATAAILPNLAPSVVTTQHYKTPTYLAKLVGNEEAAKKIQEYHIQLQRKLNGRDEESIKMMSDISVANFTEVPFRREENCRPYEYTRLCHQVSLTTHYGGGIPMPRTPFFHPYNPNGEKEENEVNFGGYPGAVITVRLPRDAFQYLPVSIKTVIQNEQLNLGNIDLFFVAQNMPWRNETLLLRAHYWLHGDPSLDEAIMNGTFSMDTPVRVGIFTPTSEEITCDNAKDILGANPISNSSHPGNSAQNNALVTIASPPGVGVLKGINFERTDSFYSVVKTASGHAAITLHWMLNPDDQALLSEISHELQDLKHLIVVVAEFKNSRLAMPNGPLSHLTALLNTTVHLEQNSRANTLTLQHDMMRAQLRTEQHKKDEGDIKNAAAGYTIKK